MYRQFSIADETGRYVRDTMPSGASAVVDPTAIRPTPHLLKWAFR
jgi:hypothetical protein